MLKIRLAQECDFSLLSNYDRHIESKMLLKQINDGHLLLAEEDTAFIGWLRYGLFWDSIPFINMLFVLEAYRGNGYGKELALAWEQAMKSDGHTTLMTSTQANEGAQHFYRALEYKDAGGFMPPDEPYELIMIKKLLSGGHGNPPLPIQTIYFPRR